MKLSNNNPSYKRNLIFIFLELLPPIRLVISFSLNVGICLKFFTAPVTTGFLIFSEFSKIEYSPDHKL